MAKYPNDIYANSAEIDSCTACRSNPRRNESQLLIPDLWGQTHF